MFLSYCLFDGQSFWSSLGDSVFFYGEFVKHDAQFGVANKDAEPDLPLDLRGNAGQVHDVDRNVELDLVLVFVNVACACWN